MMSLKMKNIFLFLALSLALVPAVRADSNSSNDSVGITVSITPNFDRGVLIDTGAVDLNMGLVDMGASTQTVSPATVTILGTVLNTELEMSGQITGGWTFDEDVSASSETDKLAVWALFKSSASANAPSKSGSDFDDAQDSLNSITSIFGPTRVGTANGNTGLNGRFEDGVTDMDSLRPGNKRYLWLYFKTPPYTSTVNEQKVNFTISVTPGP